MFFALVPIPCRYKLYMNGWNYDIARVDDAAHSVSGTHRWTGAIRSLVPVPASADSAAQRVKDSNEIARPPIRVSMLTVFSL